MRRRRWSDDFPPDVLREIAGRLHVAADFVSFHAVCKPWRDSRDPLSRSTTTNQFLPWLLASAGKHYFPLKLRCVFSKCSYHSPSPLQYAPRRSWVAIANGTALRYLTVRSICPSLHDPITGAVTDLPLFPIAHYLEDHWQKENPCGIIYGDGTILLYTISKVLAIGTIRFRAALLRPGDTIWTFVDRSIATLGRPGEFCVAYHGGRIMVTAQSSLLRVITPGVSCDVLIPSQWMAGEYAGFSGLYSYVLESHGELLWVSVQVRWRYTHKYCNGRRHVRTISVVVHALDGTSTPEKMRWVIKDGHSLADRVLFLGSPNSFAIDTSPLGGHGGCAYFAYHSNETTMRPLEQFGVFRHNLVDSKTELMDPLAKRISNDSSLNV